MSEAMTYKLPPLPDECTTGFDTWWSALYPSIPTPASGPYDIWAAAWSAAIEAQGVPDGLSDDDLSELAHSANQEAMSFGLGHDLFLRYFRTLRNRALASAPPAPQAERTLLEQYDLEQSPDYRKGWDDGRKKGYEVGVRHGKEQHLFSQASVVQQEPIYQYQLADGAWVDQIEDSYKYNQAHGAKNIRIVYTHPVQRTKPQPLSDERALEIFNDLEKFMDQIEEEDISDERLAGKSMQFILDRIAAMKGTP